MGDLNTNLQKYKERDFRLLIDDFPHLAFVQLPPGKVGKSHLDRFALDPVYKTVADRAGSEWAG